MPRIDAICYEPVPQFREWASQKERLNDLLTVTELSQTKAKVIHLRHQAIETPTVNPSLSSSKPREIPLHSLLEYGAIVLAVISALSLVSWGMNSHPLAILNPFAALLVFVASPFLYFMGRAARLS